MRRSAAAVAIAAAMLPLTVQAAPPLPAPTVVTVTMADRHFNPQIVRLRRGVPYRLRLVNQDGTEHDFAAQAFFDSSRIAREDMGMIVEGHINVPSGAERDIALIPEVAAPFDLKSTKLIDVAAGMQGQILVY